jgi:hypothetical protein
MRPFEKIPERFSVFHVAARWGIASLVHFALSEISGRDEMQSTRVMIGISVDMTIRSSLRRTVSHP